MRRRRCGETESELKVSFDVLVESFKLFGVLDKRKIGGHKVETNSKQMFRLMSGRKESQMAHGIKRDLRNEESLAESRKTSIRVKERDFKQLDGILRGKRNVICVDVSKVFCECRL